MKRGIFIIACVSIAFSGGAKAKAYRKGLQMAPGLAIGATNIGNSNVYSRARIQFDGRTFIGTHLGIGVMLNRHIGLFTGLDDDIFQWRTTTRFNEGLGTCQYLGMPFYLRFTTSRAGNIGYFANAGFKLSILVSAHEKNNTGSYDDKSPYSATNFSPTLYTGITIPAGSRVEFNVGPAIQYQLGNFFGGSVGHDLSANLWSVAGQVNANIRLSR